MEQRLDALENKRRALEKKIATERRNIAEIDAAEREARAVEVPWIAFERAAEHSDCAWKSEKPGRDAYHQIERCCGEDCWYKRNIDRVDDLKQLRVLRAVEGPTLTLCDLCYRGDELGVPDDIDIPKTVSVDPDDFEEDIAEYLKRAARNELSEDELFEMTLTEY